MSEGDPPALALLGKGGAGDSVNDALPTGWVWRRNAREGVAVAAPGRWVFFEKVFREQNDAVIVLYPPAEKLLEAAEAHLSVRVHVLPEGVRFGQYVLGHERGSTEKQGKRVLASDGTSVGGLPAHRWTFAGSKGDEVRKELTYAVAKGRRVYHMAFVAPEAAYERHAPDAERVMKSLRDAADAKDPVPPGDAAPVVLRSEDGWTELRLPAGWGAKEPRAAGAAIQAHRPAASLSAMVVRVGKSGDGQDLAAVALKKARGLEAVLKDAAVGEPAALKVNGRRAARCHVAGEYYNVRVAYDVYVVDTGELVHAAIVSSGESYYELRKGELEEVVRRLREVAPDAGAGGT
jgi:hypothetical protein